MRNFCHISEFNEQGYHLLPSMLMMSEKLILWAPAPKQLELYNNKGDTFLTTKNLLELVDKNQVSIIGRKEWITDKSFRDKNPFALAKWDDKFDNTIRLWASQDESKPISEKRVIIAENEKGFSLANEFLDKPENKGRIEVLLNRIASQQLPTGTNEKIERETSEDKKLRLALRDIYNHHLAKLNAHADQSIEPSEWVDIFNDVLGISPSLGAHNEIEPDKFWEIIEFLKEYNSASNFKDLKKILIKKDIIIDDVNKISKSNESIKEIIEKSLAKGIKVPAWSNVFSNKYMDLFSVSSLVASVVTFQYSPLASYALISGITSSVLGANYAIKIMEKHSILRKEMEGYKLPYILAYGREKATYNEAKILYEYYAQ